MCSPLAHAVTGFFPSHCIAANMYTSLVWTCGGCRDACWTGTNEDTSSASVQQVGMPTCVPDVGPLRQDFKMAPAPRLEHRRLYNKDFQASMHRQSQHAQIFYIPCVRKARERFCCHFAQLPTFTMNFGRLSLAMSAIFFATKVCACTSIGSMMVGLFLKVRGSLPLRMPPQSPQRSTCPPAHLHQTTPARGPTECLSARPMMKKCCSAVSLKQAAGQGLPLRARTFRGLSGASWMSTAPQSRKHSPPTMSPPSLPSLKFPDGELQVKGAWQDVHSTCPEQRPAFPRPQHRREEASVSLPIHLIPTKHRMAPRSTGSARTGPSARREGRQCPSAHRRLLLHRHRSR